MKLVYLVISLLPPVAVVALAWYVVRAISVRVTWRESGARRLDDAGWPGRRLWPGQLCVGQSRHSRYDQGIGD